jgi:ABC-type lipoprotein release transport system permease subunit
MLFILAWRNIWRNKKRSLIVIAAITAGLSCGLFASAVMYGMYDSLINTTIDRKLGHIQIHSKKFEDEKIITDTIPDFQSVVSNIKNLAEVSGVSSRVIIEAMCSSPTSSRGVKIAGIIPDEVKKVTSIHNQIIEGNYFESNIPSQIVIGKKLADNLDVKLKSKIVLSFQDFDGNIVYAAFRVSGIFKTESSIYDQSVVFINQRELFGLLNRSAFSHEIVLRLKSFQQVDSVLVRLSKSFPSLSVKDWKLLSPEIKIYYDILDIQLYFFMGIILFALLFGITNTMLMSVIERIREIGILIAIGMKRSRIFVMIILETIALSLVGGIAGLIFGAIVIAIVSSTGINLSAFTEGLSQFSISTVLYPVLPLTFYPVITLMIILSAIIAAIYPAIRAIKLKPATAIRTY